jgi:hypothetical protein
MTYALLNVSRTHPDGTVDGTWIQDHIGTIETAQARAEQTNAANSGALNIAVVNQLPSPVPMLDCWHNRRVARR